MSDWLIFIWSGFVRSGLGFGGAVLSLPFLLLVLDDPLVFLPIIAVHLLVFSSLTIWMNNRKSSVRVMMTRRSWVRSIGIISGGFWRS